MRWGRGTQNISDMIPTLKKKSTQERQLRNGTVTLEDIWHFLKMLLVEELLPDPEIPLPGLYQGK